jgi:hypothetical protein
LKDAAGEANAGAGRGGHDGDVIDAEVVEDDRK